MKLLKIIFLFVYSLEGHCHGGEDHSKKKSKKRVKKNLKKKRVEKKVPSIVKPKDKVKEDKLGAKTLSNGQVKSPVKTSGVIEISEEEALDKKYKKINKTYIKLVKQIFKRSCFDCHGVVKKYPWYYKVPGVKHYIDYDISESKSHLNLTRDFPFKSHSTPLQDLKAISKTVRDGSMPPFRYWIMHRNSRLKAKEKKIIGNWVIESIGILRN